MDIIQRMVWDTQNGQILDEDRRYVLLRADVLMGIFNSLPTAAKQQALSSFQHSVHKHGSNSVAAYWETINHDPDILLTSMIAISAQLGWGAWELKTRSNEKITIEVVNSPFAAASPNAPLPVCAPILGIMQSMGNYIFNDEVQVAEQRCAAQNPPNTSCIFTITPLTHVRS